MSRTIRVLLAATAVFAVASSAAGGASAKTLKGTVVHRNARAHSFTIAGRDGRLSAVHARRAPRLGRVVRVRARRLRNGTFLAQRIRGGRIRHHVKVRGTVTYRSRSRKLFVVSGRGVSLVVHKGTARVRRADDSLPAVGQDVTVDANLDDQGDIEENDVQEHGADNGTVDIEGVVLAIDEANRSLTLSADDSEESGGTLTVVLPASFDLSAFHVGDQVEFIATLNQDGSYTAVSSSGDENVGEADGAGDDQGEHHGDRRGDSHGQGGDGPRHESGQGPSGVGDPHGGGDSGPSHD